MKFSLLLLLVIVCLVAFAEAGPNDDNKPKPKPKKPKPKPKPKHHLATAAPSPTPGVSVNSVVEVLQEETILESAAENVDHNMESAGILVILAGVAAACVMAIVAIVRHPAHEHDPLPQSSESAAV